MDNMFIIVSSGGMFEESWSSEDVVFGEDNATALFDNSIKIDGEYDEYTDIYICELFKARVNEHGVVVKDGLSLRSWKALSLC